MLITLLSLFLLFNTCIITQTRAIVFRIVYRDNTERVKRQLYRDERGKKAREEEYEQYLCIILQACNTVEPIQTDMVWKLLHCNRKMTRGQIFISLIQKPRDFNTSWEKLLWNIILVRVKEGRWPCLAAQWLLYSPTCKLCSSTTLLISGREMGFLSQHLLQDGLQFWYWRVPISNISNSSHLITMHSQFPFSHCYLANCWTLRLIYPLCVAWILHVCWRVVR